MGFMGFGMQKWIYTMRPRKPFSMQRKGSFTVIPTYKRKFKLQSSKHKGTYNFGILLLLIGVIVTSFAIPNWLAKARIHHKEIIALQITQDNKAFDFLINSGKKRLKNGNMPGAYSEFKLAIAIKPTSAEINQLLFETLSILCHKNEIYCKELDELVL